MKLADDGLGYIIVWVHIREEVAVVNSMYMYSWGGIEHKL